LTDCPKLSICILTSVHSPFDVRIFHKEAKSLVNAGYNVTIIAPHDKHENINGVRVLPVHREKKRILRITKTLYNIYCKALQIDTDIYHFHDPELIPIGLLLKRHGKYVIYDAHEDAPRQSLAKSYIPSMLRKTVSTIVEAIEAFSARRFDGVVTATPFINRRFLKLGASAVNINNYPLSFEMHMGNKKWEQKEKVVCYIGGVARIRGASEMIEAIGKTQCRLLIAGNIDKSLETKLMLMPGWSRVDALGFVDRNEVKAIIGRSMAGVVLYHPELNHINAQPNKMFEYMAAGIPVIASDFPLWKEILEGARCGVCVDPLDPDQIADAIRWIVDHPEQAEQMGKNGRKAIIERYNWKREEDTLLGLYRGLESLKCSG